MSDLVGARQHFHGLSEVGIAGDLAMVVAIGAHKVGQDLGVASIRLRLGWGVPVAVATGRHRVHGEDAVASGHQRTDEQPTVDLDPHHRIARLARMVGDELMHPAYARDPIGHPGLGEHLAGVIDDADVVMGLGPIDPNEDHRASFLLDDGS